MPVPLLQGLSKTGSEQVASIIKPSFGKLVRAMGTFRRAQAARAKVAVKQPSLPQASRHVKGKDVALEKWTALAVQLAQVELECEIADAKDAVDTAEAAVKAIGEVMKKSLTDAIIAMATAPPTAPYNSTLLVKQLFVEPPAQLYERCRKVPVAIPGQVPMWYECLDVAAWCAHVVPGYVTWCIQHVSNASLETMAKEHISSQAKKARSVKPQAPAGANPEHMAAHVVAAIAGDAAHDGKKRRRANTADGENEVKGDEPRATRSSSAGRAHGGKPKGTNSPKGKSPQAEKARGQHQSRRSVSAGKESTKSRRESPPRGKPAKGKAHAERPGAKPTSAGKGNGSSPGSKGQGAKPRGSAPRV